MGTIIKDGIATTHLRPQSGGGSNGHSPYIGPNGNWFEYDDTSERYVDTGVPASGGGGTTDHNVLINREMANQHPISAITDLERRLKDIDRFKGFVSPTQPVPMMEGAYWYQGESLPTTFPVQVKVFEGTHWSETTIEYTADVLDVWTVIEGITSNDWYYAIGGWRLLGEDKTPELMNVERWSPYLYKIDFDKLVDYIPDTYDSLDGACTSYIKDMKLFRNYDFRYDSNIEFLTSVYDDEHKVHYQGMAYIKGIVPGEMNTAALEQLPYHLVDGVNEYGLMVAVHLVYNDYGYSGPSTGIPATKVVQEILSRCKTITDVDNFTELKQIRMPASLGNYVPMYIVSDGNSTRIIYTSDVDPEYKVANWSDIGKITNFMPLYEVQEIVKTGGAYPYWLQSRPNGIVRYNTAKDSSLEELAYTKCYLTTDRLDEFIGINGTDKTTDDAILRDIYNEARIKYQNRTRNGDTWHTLHSIVYSCKGTILHLWAQEDYQKDYIAGSASGGGNSTSEVILEDPTTESISSTASNQFEVNREVVRKLEEIDNERLTRFTKILYVDEWSGSNQYEIEFPEGSIGRNDMVIFDVVSPMKLTAQIFEDKIIMTASEKPETSIVVDFYRFTSNPNVILDEKIFTITINKHSILDLRGFNILPPAIDWGDGTIDASSFHEYEEAGTYTIKAVGKLEVESISRLYSMGASDIVNLSVGYCPSVTALVSANFVSSGSLEKLDLTGFVNLVTITGTFAYSCRNLKEVYMPTKQAVSISSNTFKMCPLLEKIHCGSALSEYRKSPDWAEFYSKLVY